MSKLNKKFLRKMILNEIKQLNERRPGEITNIAGAMEKLYDVFVAKKNYPPQYGGFPAELAQIMVELKFNDDEKEEVYKAYRTK